VNQARLRRIGFNLAAQVTDIQAEILFLRYIFGAPDLAQQEFVR
jgi:hypothetical protein